MDVLKQYSLITEEDTILGLPSNDKDALLLLGDIIATSRPSVIVHLQKWTDDDVD
jgi:hypothetical protein